MSATNRLLVSPQELSRHLDDPHWVIVDTRHDLGNPAKGRELYAQGHVPGAFFLHLDADLSGPCTGRNGRHPLPDIDAFTRCIAACGLTPAAQVVAYDEGGGAYAARLWWLLRWLGHERVALLDGGIAAWQREGHPLSREAPAARAGSFVPRPQLGATVDAAFVERFHRAHEVKLVDARSAGRYAGQGETLDPVAGHVPGALNRFWHDNLGDDSRFKSPQALRAEWRALLGDGDPARSVHMCGSGVTACHNLFALELAGLGGARLYPGSWSEWCADPSRPVATGAAP